MDILGNAGGLDPDREKIIDIVTKETYDALHAIAGDNILARAYMHNLWKSVIDALQEADIDANTTKLPEVLHIIANAYDTRLRMIKELDDKRAAELKVVADKVVDKVMSAKKDTH